MKADIELYKYHVENLKQLESAIKAISQPYRKAISSQNQKQVTTFTSMYSLLLGSWAEVRLLKMLFEENGFGVDDRKRVLSRDTQIDKWKCAVTVAFSKHYKAKKISVRQIGHTAFRRYSTINEIIEQDLRPIIEIRNRLAHGQWFYLLNAELNDIAQSQMTAMRKENLFSLQFKKTILSWISALVNDLIVSIPTFERDFDRNYQQLLGTKQNLLNRSYDSYKAQLIAKHQRGLKKRRLQK